MKLSDRLCKELLAGLHIMFPRYWEKPQHEDLCAYVTMLRQYDAALTYRR